MPYYLSTEKAVMLLLAVPLICFLLVIAVVLPEMTTNVLLQLACGPFRMSLSDGRSVGPVRKFSHYAYDGRNAAECHQTPMLWSFRLQQMASHHSSGHAVDTLRNSTRPQPTVGCLSVFLYFAASLLLLPVAFLPVALTHT